MKITLLPSLLFISVLSVAVLQGCSGTDLTDAEYVALAKDHQDKGDLQASLIELKNALKINPDNPEARWLLGGIYIKLGAGASAEKELRRAVKLGLTPESAEIPLTRAFLLRGKNQEVIDSDFSPNKLSDSDQAELLALRADAYFGTENLDKAEELYDMALAIKADIPEARTGKARLAIMQNDLDEARKRISAVLEKTPDFASALSLLGLMETWDGNLEKAEEAYTKAMQDPVYAIASQYHRVFLRIRLKKFDQAAEDINELKKRLKDIPSVSYAEGLLHFAQGNFTEAQGLFEHAIGLAPNHAGALFYAGATHTVLGNTLSASTYLRRHLALNPRSVAAQRLLAQVELQSGNPAEAEKLALQVMKEDPEDVFTMNLLADASTALGNEEAVVSYRRRMVATQPDSPGAKIRLGNTLINMGEADEGLRELQQVLEQYPGEHGAAQSLIQQHQRLGDFDAALNTAREHRDSQPGSAVAHVLLGTVYLSRKETGEATKVFERALEIEPNNVSVYHALALISIQEKDLNSANGYYQEALKARPGDLKTLMNLANLHAMQGDQVSRIKVLEDAITSNPNALQPVLSLGRIYLAEGEAGKAIDIVEEKRSQYVSNKDLLGLLAEAQLADGRYDEAKVTLIRLNKLVPEEARVYYALAAAYQGLNDSEKMREALDKAAALDPDAVPPQIVLARLAIEQRNIAAAESRIVAIKKRVSKDNPELLQLEAQLAEIKGDWSDAVTAYERLFNQEATSVNLRRLARAQWNAGHKDKAVQDYEQWAQEHPQDARVLLELSARYMTLERNQDAIETYKSLLELAPDNVLALNNLASLLNKTDPEAALGYAQRAYSLAPEAPGVLDTLAGTLLSTGDTERAARMIERALTKQPDNPSFLYRRAQILEAGGQGEEAIRVLDEILQPGRSFRERREAEAMLERLRSRS